MQGSFIFIHTSSYLLRLRIQRLFPYTLQILIFELFGNLSNVKIEESREELENNKQMPNYTVCSAVHDAA